MILSDDSMAEQILESRYRRRRRRNATATILALAATMIGLGWLVLILGALLWQGFSGLSVAVFTEMTPPPGAAGGLLNPIVGSLILTVIAVVIGTPIGILAGTYMAEYGRHDPLTSVVRFINDILWSRRWATSPEWPAAWHSPYWSYPLLCVPPRTC